MKRRILMLNIVVTLLLCFPVHSFSAGIPVFDGSNLSQTTIAAFENVNQTLKQLEQYATQLQQLEIQLKNAALPSTALWQQVEQTIQNVQRLQGKVMSIYASIENMDSYLENFKDVNYYRNLLRNNKNVTPEQLTKSAEWFAAERDKQNREFLKSIADRKSVSQAQAEDLKNLAKTAGGATGQLQALQYANQFAQREVGQLIAIQKFLEEQRDAAVLKELAEADEKAAQKAAHEAFFDVPYQPQPVSPLPDFR